MAVCRDCGYELGPFDAKCPRCARRGVEPTSGQKEIDELLSAAKELSAAQEPVEAKRRPGPSRRGAPASPRRQLLIGAIASAVILLGGIFIIAELRHSGLSLRANPLSDGSASTDPFRQNNAPTGAGPAPSAPSGTGAANQPPTEPADTGTRDLLQQCPFDLRVGGDAQAVKESQETAEVQLGFQGDQLTYLASGTWRVQGKGGQALQAEAQVPDEQGNVTYLWPDQPFEVYQNGQLVGAFQNTQEYWDAQR